MKWHYSTIFFSQVQTMHCPVSTSKNTFNPNTIRTRSLRIDLFTYCRVKPRQKEKETPKSHRIDLFHDIFRRFTIHYQIFITFDQTKYNRNTQPPNSLIHTLACINKYESNFRFVKFRVRQGRKRTMPAEGKTFRQRFRSELEITNQERRPTKTKLRFGKGENESYIY